LTFIISFDIIYDIIVLFLSTLLISNSSRAN